MVQKLPSKQLLRQKTSVWSCPLTMWHEYQQGTTGTVEREFASHMGDQGLSLKMVRETNAGQRVIRATKAGELIWQLTW